MPVSPNFLEFVLDQLSGLRSVRSRRMFGGIGLYCDDLFFGIVDDDVVYFRVDDSNRDDYTARGCEPFRPFGDETTSMSYFRVPSDVLEDVDHGCVPLVSGCGAAQNAVRDLYKSRLR